MFDRRSLEPGVYEHRVSVNYLRHVYTDYECLLSLCRESGLTCDGEIDPHFDQIAKLPSGGISVYRNKVYAAIAATYPHLQAECERQQRERDNRSGE